MRQEPHQSERNALALGNREFADVAKIFPAELDRRAQQQRVGAADGEEAAVDAAHPRDERSVIHPNDQLHAHPHLAALSDRHSNDIGILGARRHAIDQRDRAIFGLVLRLQDERALAIAPADCAYFVGGRDQPPSLIRRAEERSETGGGIEARKAQPVDRSVAAHQGRRLAIADQCVVFNSRCHGCSGR